MEYDVPSGLYHAGSNYYSPQLTRPVSEAGPTPGRTSGNPSSPGDVPGFGGGGGSFAWTYSNLQPQLSASMAAGAGAAGLTAGAAALVSTLGLDIGLTVSAAGPVVGALTGLGFLFADLFGGGPDIPKELRLPAHSLLGMEQFAGQTDVVDQKTDSAPAWGGEPLACGLRRVQELLPFEPGEPFFVEPEPFDPFGDFSLLPRKLIYERCLNAAEIPALWPGICRDVPNRDLKRECWSVLLESPQMKRGFCASLFAT